MKENKFTTNNILDVYLELGMINIAKKRLNEKIIVFTAIKNKCCYLQL